MSASIPPPRALSATAAPSTFHAKGLMYRGALDFYEHFLPGGLDALRGELDAELREFFLDESFLASSWYDILPIIPISQAAARVKGIAHRELVRANAAWIADRDMRGVHRFILRVASAKLVVGRLPRLSMQYFDFGDTDGRMVDERRFETTRVGIPVVLADWMVWVIEGFTPVVLQAAGARVVLVEQLGREPDGRMAGMDTVRIELAIRWT